MAQSRGEIRIRGTNFADSSLESAAKHALQHGICRMQELELGLHRNTTTKKYLGCPPIKGNISGMTIYYDAVIKKSDGSILKIGSGSYKFTKKDGYHEVKMTPDNGDVMTFGVEDDELVSK